MRFDEHFIKQALPDVSILQGTISNDFHFSIDSRTIKTGDIFVALQGSKCDGHNFIIAALKNGAAGLIIAESKKSILNSIDTKLLSQKLILVVPDTLKALVDLAKSWRAQFDCPVIAITGSVGKTSTKEIIANILDVSGKNYLVSYGNQNTKIGVALNMLHLRAHHEMAVFEVGISKRGEMAELAAIVQPTNAVITNIGHCHMEGLGSLYDIALEKRDIFKYFSEDSIGIINGDQSVLATVSYPHPIVKFGSKTTNQIQARKIRVTDSHISFVLKIYKKKYPITLEQSHAGSVFNILAATTIAHLLDISSDSIVKAIQIPVVVAGRFEQKHLHASKGVIINDCYNANPESMKTALLAFQQINTKSQKIAVLGDMLELGVNSPFWHRQIGRFLRKISSLKHVILVGQEVKWTKKTLPVNLGVDVVPSWQEAITVLNEKLKDRESMVLVKGSLGIGLQNLVSAFTSNL